ncbi:YdeI/OmpD-associated family protein [Aquimarina rhabdastrellae]
MEKHTSVDAYIEAKPQWTTALKVLRSIALASGLTETVKWGVPVYTTKNGKNVIGLGAFKSYVGVWFYNGALLKDEANMLLNAQEGKTKALRQWRFESLEAIPQELLKAYVDEAIQNQLAGKEIKPVKKVAFEIPSELETVLNEDVVLKEKFKELTAYKQREYAEHISEAKREATKQNRLKKIIPMIQSGIGLNDKYRK